MCKLRYKLLSPVRFLLPLSVVMFVIPMFVQELMNYYIFPIFYFFGAYFCFLNFPSIAEQLHSQPIYLEDLVIARSDGDLDRSFQNLYSVIMNFILAGLLAAFADYIIIEGVRKLPLTKMLAIIGGNISLYMKTQDAVGQCLISFIHMLKTNKETEDSEFRDSSTIEIELEELPSINESVITSIVTTVNEDIRSSKI